MVEDNIAWDSDAEGHPNGREEYSNHPVETSDVLKALSEGQSSASWDSSLFEDDCFEEVKLTDDNSEGLIDDDSQESEAPFNTSGNSFDKPCNKSEPYDLKDEMTDAMKLEHLILNNATEQNQEIPASYPNKKWDDLNSRGCADVSADLHISDNSGSTVTDPDAEMQSDEPLQLQTRQENKNVFKVHVGAEEELL